MQKARRHSLSCSDRLQAYGFRVYFTPLFTVLFTFPSRYQFTIGLSGVFSLTGWSRWIQSRFHVPRPTQDTHKIYKTVPIRDFHSLWCVFPNTSNPALQPISGSYYPHIAVTIWVWAVPISLATTLGITFVFFSSAYLDVSVQRVCSSCDVVYLQYTGLPHSDICGSTRMCQSPQLFAAYHVLLRL